MPIARARQPIWSRTMVGVSVPAQPPRHPVARIARLDLPPEPGSVWYVKGTTPALGPTPWRPRLVRQEWFEPTPGSVFSSHQAIVVNVGIPRSVVVKIIGHDEPLEPGRAIYATGKAPAGRSGLVVLDVTMLAGGLFWG